ncbi:unnamed protein product [Durusdinium trenchii]|uniref:Uncharacterized protein n=1 Tax=Durusdinium trenchii TaxID=1381693 RepID=A0ABP0MS11_9DINO
MKFLRFLVIALPFGQAAKFVAHPVNVDAFDDGVNHNIDVDETYFEEEDEVEASELKLAENKDALDDDSQSNVEGRASHDLSSNATISEESQGSVDDEVQSDVEDHGAQDLNSDATISEEDVDGRPSEEADVPMTEPALLQESASDRIIPPERQYVGSLTDPKAHPYVYTSREAATTACQQLGYRGLCSKGQVEGWSKCAWGWMSDYKGFWYKETKQYCGHGKGWRDGKDIKKMGAYCCNLAMNSLYIGSLSNPEKHPYVYSSRIEAEEACHKAGYRGLCSKSQIEGYARCAAGWLSDSKGYWFDRTKHGCGHGRGFRGWGAGKVGAYCCAPTVNNIQYIGSIHDTAAHPYVYDTRSDAEKACKAAGYHGLCRKGQAGGYSRCAAGWYSDYKGYWFHKKLAGCVNQPGWAGWGAGKVGAYCCNLASNVQYIGSLSNPKAHPYVYETKTDAEKACSTAGYQRLCRKFEIEGFAKCAAGWLADYKGYWFDRTKSGCGHGVGYRGWGNGKVGAYCCSPKDNIKFVGKLSDPSAMPYVYTTRDDAENACKKSGYRRLCYRSEIEFHSECKAGWMKDFKGYWFDRTHQHCGTGIGYRSWGAADAAGAYCCEKLELPLCHEDRLSASKGVWRCDEYSGTTGEENACVEKYQQIETDGKTRYFKCVASNAGGGRFNCLAGESCQPIYPRGLPENPYTW